MHPILVIEWANGDVEYHRYEHTEWMKWISLMFDVNKSESVKSVWRKYPAMNEG